MRLDTLRVWQRSLLSYNTLAREALLALGVGVIVALAAWAFERCITLVGMGLAALFPLAQSWARPCSLAAGGLAVGLLLWWRAADFKTRGISGVIASVYARQGLIPGREALLGLLASSLTLGSGGSAGKEGPIVQIGASLGSKIAQLFQLTHQQTVLLLGCGAAAGIASAFGAPLAGVFLALEVILTRFSYHASGLLILSSLSAYLGTKFIATPLFHFQAPPLPPLESWELLAALGLGIGAACVGTAFMRTLAGSEKFFQSLPLPAWSRPALGGLLAGGIAIFFPQVMGSGYDSMERALVGEFSLSFMAALLIFKIGATACTLGSGGAGGDLAPSLFLGAMWGGIYGLLLQDWMALAPSSLAAYTLLGLGSVFAGAARAPLSASFIIVEMSANYQLLLPLILTTAVSALVSSVLDRDSLYTLKLSRGIVALQAGEAPILEPLETAPVGRYLSDDYLTISPQATVAQLMELLKSNPQAVWAVCDEQGAFKGLVDRRDVAYWRMRCHPHLPQKTLVREIMRTDIDYLTPNDSLASALYLMGRSRSGRLPILEAGGSRRLLGVITRQAIFQAYLHLSSQPAPLEASHG